MLHTIFFYRALGLTKPRDVFIEKLGVTYVSGLHQWFVAESLWVQCSCGNLEMERLVEIKVNEFCEYLNRSKQNTGQV